MKHRQLVWGLVLAGGDGSRLHSHTLNGQGVAVPMQYCSWQGGTSLLADALNRAAAVAPQERLCAVVAAQHRQWWAEGILDCIPDSNVFVQPRNRGTAHGILLSLVKISARDNRAGPPPRGTRCALEHIHPCRIGPDFVGTVWLRLRRDDCGHAQCQLGGDRQAVSLACGYRFLARHTPRKRGKAACTDGASLRMDRSGALSTESPCRRQLARATPLKRRSAYEQLYFVETPAGAGKCRAAGSGPESRAGTKL